MPRVWVHLRGEVGVWLVDITVKKKGGIDSVSCGGVNGENERNGGAGQRESRDLRVAFVFGCDLVLRDHQSLTSAAFFSDISSFSWASFRASEYLSNSSSVPFSFFCIWISSSSCWEKETKEYESGRDGKGGRSEISLYEIIHYYRSSHNHFYLKFAQSDTFRCCFAHLLLVIKAIPCPNVNLNTLIGNPNLSHILSPTHNSLLHLLLRLCLPTLHSSSGRSQPCNCYLMLGSVSQTWEIEPWRWALFFQKGCLDSCQHWPGALYS